MPGQVPGDVPHFAHPPSIPVHHIPPPPLPTNCHSFPLPSDPPITFDLAEHENGTDSHHMGENLNPDVPEFIPVTVRIQDENGDHNSTETERGESGQHYENLEINYTGM
jgi:hypothetical protein